MDLEFWTDRPEKRATCKACTRDWLSEGDAPPHSCRTRPSLSRTTIEDRTRAAHRVFAQREFQIRAERMAEIDLAQIRRGRA